MKQFYLFVVLLSLLCPGLMNAQCDTTAIPQSNYSIYNADTFTGDKIPENAIDGDPATFWNTGGSVAFPHSLIIDLGEEKPVNAISIKPRINSNLGKLDQYEIYLATDISDIPFQPESAGQLIYTGYWQEVPQFIHFGAITARYVYLNALSNFDTGNSNRLMISEFVVFEDATCGDQGKANQIISFDSVMKQTTDSDPIELSATSNQGTDVSFEIVEGADIVTLDGSTLSFGNGAGTVVLRAFNEGDDDFYPSATDISFEVINLQDYAPSISSRLTDAVPLTKSAEGIYPIYVSSSIGEPQFLSVESVSISVDGEAIPVENVDGAYVGLWTLGDAGIYEVAINSIGSNGIQTELVRNIEVVEGGSTMTARAMDDVLVNFPNPGRTITIDTILPQFLGTYKKVTAYLDVDCPNISGGCDDWDRKGYFEIQTPDGKWVEFIRYMTPYGVGCTHYADVTDFMDLLQGEVKLRVFIDTWGTGGWEFTIDLEFEEGEPDYLYRNLTKVWDKNSAPFGNPSNLQPMETVDIAVADNVEAAKLRLTTTGHGWGNNNTGNAAEFYYATHNLAVNGQNTFEQYLYNVCNPNPDGCTGQQGTWYFERAGWCPGAISPAFEFNLSPFLSNSSFTLDYIFQTSYIDQCHANNPNCISGVTCQDCNDGFNPIYMIDGYVISYSNTFSTQPNNVYENELPEESFIVSPNPVQDMLTIKSRSAAGAARILLIDVSGKIIKRSELDSFALQSGETQVFVGDLEAGTYFVRIFTSEGSQTYKVIKL